MTNSELEHIGTTGSGQSEILYHYCSNQALVGIVSDQAIRLSSLLLSNDSMEGKLVGHLLAKRIQEEGGEYAWKAEYVWELAAALSEYAGGYGFCLSEKDDLLSQWRGYADDGRGVTIGFSREYLESRYGNEQSEIQLRPVKYKSNEDLEAIQNLYETISKSILKVWDPKN